ncbi:MAG TPA: hypothetical protein VII76_14085 [Acidimicrobiales bacterium]
MVLPLKLDRRAEYRARRRSGLIVVLVSGMAAVTMAACGTAPAGRTVTLLPAPGAKATTWQWTGSCRLGPVAPRGCASAGPHLGPAQLTGDAWNLGTSTTNPGSLDMAVDSRGAVTVEGHLPSAPPCTQSTCIAPSANTWVRGYPSVLYGINQCSARTSPPVSRRVGLPMRVGSIPPDLIGTTAYTARTPHITYDIAYDMWLNHSDTKTPCTADGTLEVMVWTDYNEQALLPDNERVGTASVPFVVDGTQHPGNGAWSVYVSNVFGNGHTQPWGGTVWFVLDKADTVRSGTVGVDLSTVLSEVGTELQNAYGWKDFRSTYWLDTIPFGIEFGPESGALYGAGPSYFSLRLSSYCLGVGMTLSEPGCPGAP